MIRTDFYLLTLLAAFALWYLLPVISAGQDAQARVEPGSISVLKMPQTPSELTQSSTSADIEQAPISQPEEVELPSAENIVENVNNEPVTTQANEKLTAGNMGTNNSLAITGRSENIFELIAYLQNSGGAVWLDDGYFGSDKIYEIDKRYRLTGVTEEYFTQAIDAYVPRSMSRSEYSEVMQRIDDEGSFGAKRLILLWPKSIWIDIQDRAKSLSVDQAELRYKIVGGQLKLQVINARLGGQSVEKLRGRSI